MLNRILVACWLTGGLGAQSPACSSDTIVKTSAWHQAYLETFEGGEATNPAVNEFFFSERRKQKKLLFENKTLLMGNVSEGAVKGGTDIREQFLQ